ncbi:MAG TPA: LysM domain-containing protein [Lacunisphaera sp.]|jgi:LysM repeat protein
MDTLSRDSSNSGSILPIASAIVGGLALILAAVALVKLSTLQKTVAAQADQVAKIDSIESDAHSASAAAAKAGSDLNSLRSGIQAPFDQIGTEFGQVKARLTAVEDAQKARAAAPSAKAGKNGAPAVVTGTVDANGNYTVAPGDNLSKIAKKFAVRVDALEAENPGLDPTKVKIGQKIKIPKK